MRDFIWWHVVDGVALALPDTKETRAAIDSGALRNVYGSIEGAIINGGVIATAFERRTEETFDAAAWLLRGERIPAGQITVTTITAEPRTCQPIIHVAYMQRQNRATDAPSIVTLRP